LNQKVTELELNRIIKEYKKKFSLWWKFIIYLRRRSNL